MRLKCGVKEDQFGGCYSMIDAINVLERLQERPEYRNLLHDFFSAACRECSGDPL